MNWKFTLHLRRAQSGGNTLFPGDEQRHGDEPGPGAAELRHKESDRIATVVDGLRGLGGEIEATEDGFEVRGTGGLRGGTLDSAGDHRLAMLGAVAGLASESGVEVGGMGAAAVSYPAFADHLAGLGSTS